MFEQLMDNFERLMKANKDTAAESMRQVPHLKRQLNSQDTRIINACDAIIITQLQIYVGTLTSAHKCVVANKDQGTLILYKQTRTEMYNLITMQLSHGH